MIEPTSLAVPARPATRWALGRQPPAASRQPPAASHQPPAASRPLAALSQAFQRLPQSLIALLARLSIAALSLSLMAGEPGRWSIDHWLARRGPR